MSKIPILKPKLPDASRILPYLEDIDASRIYSNFGPLTLSFEGRLAANFGVQSGMVTTVANATLGLTLALIAMGAQPGTLCLMPAWTFIASAHAVVAAGLSPYFVDVDPQTWTIDVDTVDELIACAPGPVGAIMVVAPFGRPIAVEAWDRFRARTGLPVIIDAAAGFDSLQISSTPSVVSLHATKVIGIGEGGFVASTDEALISAVRARSNFGFSGSRTSIAPSLNAKLSEYHAAVGHAALDEWPEIRTQWMRGANTYRKVLNESDCIRYQSGFGIDWISSTCVVEVPGSDIVVTERALADAGIETRRWWGQGSHLHPSTSRFARGPLPATEALAKSTLGIPFFRELDHSQIERVAEVMQAAMIAK